ncbi:MAG TPA: hypothetical protein VFI00_02455 [Kribbella sp.]|nr:hypothetical protein [Kribbella sp.]
MRRNWPLWTGYATAIWSLAYGVLGVYWTLGGDVRLLPATSYGVCPLWTRGHVPNRRSRCA